MTDNQHQRDNSGKQGYEPYDINFRTTLKIIGGFIAGLLIVLITAVGVLRLFQMFEEKSAAGPQYFLADTSEYVITAEEQDALTDTLLSIIDRADMVLSSYKWVSMDSQLVRIPIDDAMGLLLERGFPVRENPGIPHTATLTSSGLSQGYTDEAPSTVFDLDTIRQSLSAEPSITGSGPSSRKGRIRHPVGPERPGIFNNDERK